MIVNKKYGLTPLMCAAFKINYERVNFLIDAGANINTVDSSNQSALLYVLTKIKEIPNKCSECNTCNTKINTIVKIITKICKNNINLDILTPDLDNLVMIAIKLGFTQAVKIFCNYNFNIHHKNIDGKTAMALAIENNYPIICYYLWKKGADINSIDDKKHTFLMTLVYNSGIKESVSYDMIEDVLKNNPNVNARDIYNTDAIMYACRGSALNIIELLIKYGAGVNNALFSAVHLNKIEYIEMLCSSHGFIDYNILIKAAKKLKYKDIEHLLIKKSIKKS